MIIDKIIALTFVAACVVGIIITIIVGINTGGIH